MPVSTDDARCAFSGLIDADRLDGNGVLRGNCPGCGRRYVTADPVETPEGPWSLREHKVPQRVSTYGWPTLADLHARGL